MVFSEISKRERKTVGPEFRDGSLWISCDLADHQIQDSSFLFTQVLNFKLPIMFEHLLTDGVKVLIDLSLPFLFAEGPGFESH